MYYYKRWVFAQLVTQRGFMCEGELCEQLHCLVWVEFSVRYTLTIIFLLTLQFLHLVKLEYKVETSS